MTEVLWHGRGGQGAFTAARLLGAAAMLDGRWALAFPSFGPERRGAPMRAFTKIADEPIGDRSALAQADLVVYLDDTLLKEGWEAELRPNGRALVNSQRTFDDPRLVSIDADALSTEVLGRAIPNTVLIGALACWGVVSLEGACQAVREYMPARLHEKNLELVARAYELAKGWEDGCTGAVAAAGAAAAMGAASSAAGSFAANCDRAAAPCDVRRPEAHIPRLRSQLAEPPSLDAADFARSTCFAAGHLVTKNAGWRSRRPIIDEDACTGCGQCLLYCPDGALFLGQAGAEVPLLDDDFCKGCGICARTCRFGAISMMAEEEAASGAAIGSVPAEQESEVVA